MKEYRCIIVDDEELARDLIKIHLEQLDDFYLVASCSSAIDAHNLLKTEQVDLMFLDIEMPVLKGTDFYQNLVNKPQVIFTTAFRDYAIDGFELNAVDYLLKPIIFSRFLKAIEKFKTITNNQMRKVEAAIPAQRTAKHIFVRENRRHVKVVLDEILYIQGLKDYIKIFMIDGSHIIKSTLAGFEKQLPLTFLRIHRSYIINKSKVNAYTSHDIEIGENELPIGDNYKEVTRQSLS